MSEGKIFRKYVLKNAILPVVTVFGINLAYVCLLYTSSRSIPSLKAWRPCGKS